VPFSLQTDRLALRELDADDPADARFVLALLNDADWIRHIRDAGVLDLEQARRYILTGPQAMYRSHGHGLWRVADRSGDQALGLCGLIRREGLNDPDLGYGFLPAARGRGYAQEAALAVLDWTRRELGCHRVVAIVQPGNGPSLRLLARLGMREEGLIQLAEGQPMLKLLSIEFDPRPVGAVQICALS